MQKSLIGGSKTRGVRAAVPCHTATWRLAPEWGRTPSEAGGAWGAFIKPDEAGNPHSWGRSLRTRLWGNDSV
jgi:hypothetical protein